MLYENGPHKIQYEIKRTSRRRSVGIQVLPDARVVFRVPQRFSKDLHPIIEKHADWILRKQNQFKNQAETECAWRRSGSLKECRTQAMQAILECISRFQPMVGIHPRKISIRNQKTRWGSCNRHRHLSFNWRLALVPREILDYVVVHEMCHMLHLDHSHRFWDKVKSILPDYRERRRWLKKQPIL